MARGIGSGVLSFGLNPCRDSFRHSGSGLKIKNAITDLRVMFNWAMEPREEGGPGLLDKNPVTKKCQN